MRISAMAGRMNTLLNILGIDISGNHNIYSLKDDHKIVVKSVLDYY